MSHPMGPLTETQYRVLGTLYDRDREGLTRDEIPQLARELGMTEELFTLTLGTTGQAGMHRHAALQRPGPTDHRLRAVRRAGHGHGVRGVAQEGLDGARV
jgi:hypothetical protein